MIVCACVVRACGVPCSGVLCSLAVGCCVARRADAHCVRFAVVCDVYGFDVRVIDWC